MNEADGIRLLEFLDGTLSQDERARVEAWLAVDPEARQVLDQHRRAWQMLGEAYSAPDVQPSEEFRRRAIERARQSQPARRTWLGLTSRGAGLLAASLIAVIGLFAWFERSRAPEPWISPEDRDVVMNLDLLQSRDFLDKRGDQLDLARGIDLVAAFDGELPPEATR